MNWNRAWLIVSIIWVLLVVVVALVNPPANLGSDYLTYLLAILISALVPPLLLKGLGRIVQRIVARSRGRKSV
jgi:hypothetical protein